MSTIYNNMFHCGTLISIKPSELEDILLVDRMHYYTLDASFNPDFETLAQIWSEC